MKLDEFISDILITGSKDYLGFIGGKGRNFRKDISLLLSPTKGPGQKTRVVRILAAYIGPKNDRTLGFQPCDNIEADDACAIARLSTETCTVKLLYHQIRIYFRLPILGSMIIVKELLYFVTRLCAS
jgi:hypothetical protein